MTIRLEKEVRKKLDHYLEAWTETSSRGQNYQRRQINVAINLLRWMLKLDD